MMILFYNIYYYYIFDIYYVYCFFHPGPAKKKKVLVGGVTGAGSTGLAIQLFPVQGAQSRPRGSKRGRAGEIEWNSPT